MAIEFELCPPKPRSLVESLRSVGYSVPTAIADIVDNSVAARSRRIWIEFHWAGPDSRVTILDDGHGMDEATLASAMRAGSANPLDTRRADDLGRFGLGLKTASFSQCRKLTVWSKATGEKTSGRCWDLDFVAQNDEWRLIKPSRPEGLPAFEQLESMNAGTLVIWEQLDRAVDQSPASSSEAHRRFLAMVGDVHSHLGMIFHRYLDGRVEPPRQKLQIFVNGADEANSVRGWDPFSVPGGPPSKESPVERMSVGGHQVSIRGFVLPHRDRLSDSQRAHAAGPRGWVAQQGFYIYRNDRVIVAGDWLRLGRARAWTKDEQFKLARLSVDIPNVMDDDWSLDIKKSTARPPAAIRERLTDLADSVRSDARRVFSHRGEYGPRPLAPQVNVERPWIAANRVGRIVYTINRSHPLIAECLRRLGPLADQMKPLLRLVEETVPVQKIWLDTAESADEHAQPYEGYDETVILDDLSVTRTFLERSFKSRDALRQYLLAIEPFRRYPALVERALKET